MVAAALRPVLRSRKLGDDRLVIEWNDGHRSEYLWRICAIHCPCAGCREERLAAARSVSRPKPNEWCR